MAIQDVLQFGNPLLREPCVDVVDFETPETLTMVEEWDRHHPKDPQNGQSV